MTHDESQSDSISEVGKSSSSEKEWEGVKDDGGNGDGSGGEGIAVGFGDISALRESLECDLIIRKSIVSR